MVRTQISLSEEQKRRLDEESARTGASLAELIRRAVDRMYRDDVSTEDALATIASATGAWSDREESGEAYVERIRSGRQLTR